MSRMHPAEFILIAAIIACAAMVAMSVLAARGGLTYELARYDGAGNRYVDDYGLTLSDCMAAMHGKRSTGCEVER